MRSPTRPSWAVCWTSPPRPIPWTPSAPPSPPDPAQASPTTPMNLLVTAGNTLAPIDRVRGLTNVFTGRTGAAVALGAHGRGHRVVLLTSRPDAVSALHPDAADLGERWTVLRYSSFDDL